MSIISSYLPFYKISRFLSSPFLYSHHSGLFARQAQELVNQVAFTLRALPDKLSLIKVHLPAAGVHISGDAMTLQRTRGRC